MNEKKTIIIEIERLNDDCYSFKVILPEGIDENDEDVPQMKSKLITVIDDYSYLLEL